MRRFLIVLGLLAAGCAGGTEALPAAAAPAELFVAGGPVVCDLSIFGVEVKFPSEWRLFEPGKDELDPWDPCAGPDLLDKIRADENFWPTLLAAVRQSDGAAVSIGLWSPVTDQPPVTLEQVANASVRGAAKKRADYRYNVLESQTRTVIVGNVEKLYRVVRVDSCGRGRVECDIEMAYARVRDARTGNEFFFDVQAVATDEARRSLVRREEDGRWFNSGVHDTLDEILDKYFSLLQ